MIEAPRLNPLRVFGQGRKGEASLSLEDCCQIGHQLQGVLLLESGPELPVSPQVSEDWFNNQPELGQGYVREMSSEEVVEEGGVICLPPLTLGHVGAFVIKRMRVSPLLSEVSMGISWWASPCVEACWATEEEEEGLAGARACLSPSEVVVVWVHL